MRMGSVELDLDLQGLGLGLQRVLNQWDRDRRQMAASRRNGPKPPLLFGYVRARMAPLGRLISFKQYGGRHPLILRGVTRSVVARFRHDRCRAGPDCMDHTIITFSAEASDERCDCNIDVSGFACTPYGLDVNVFDRKTQEDAEELSSAQDLRYVRHTHCDHLPSHPLACQCGHCPKR